jgi:glycosyltransferase involved in cell wall biosynthesis
MEKSPLVSGLAIIRNGVKLDYAFLESIRSALPICDEFICVVGKSSDDTRARIAALDDPKIRIVDTDWSDHVQPRKCLLAQQTNIGLHLCRGVWCLYMQSAEVLHEESLLPLRAMMEQTADDPKVEALLLERLTFYGDGQHVLRAYPEAFKYVPRIIKPHIGAHSIRDAMSFAVFDGWSTRGRYPRAMDSGEYLYRYALVHTPEGLAARGTAVHHAHGDAGTDPDAFYTRVPRAWVAEFAGSHPEVMGERLGRIGQQYDSADSRCRQEMSIKERLRLLESAAYRKIGLPSWRGQRFDLLGKFRTKKDRPW